MSLKHLPLKSVAGALLFSVFLGPLGLLYASSLGGAIMIAVGFIVVSVGFTVPIIIMWLVCSVWSVIAVNRYNERIVHAKKNHKTEFRSA